jgi:HSP20 family molecular chaperone IbpA
MVESARGGGSPPAERRPVCQPNVDIHESADGLVLRADVPGVTKETLDLYVEENILKIYARSASQMPAGGMRVHHEFRLSDFYRSFILGDEIDAENIKAEIEDGVLTLRLPKKQVRRRIDVEVT